VNYQPGYESPINGGALAVVIVLYIVLIGFVVWCYVRVIRRSGYSGWWVLMALVPIGNLIMLGFFAFQEWPIQRELEYLRRHASMTGLPGYASPPQQYGYGQGPYGYGPPAPGPEQRRPEDGSEGPNPPTP